jgi:hypothetical protein
MPIDKDSLENLNREFELVVEREQKKLEEKLELELQGLRPSKPLTQEDKARVASNFWSRERPKMDAKIKRSKLRCIKTMVAVRMWLISNFVIIKRGERNFVNSFKTQEIQMVFRANANFMKCNLGLGQTSQ